MGLAFRGSPQQRRGCSEKRPGSGVDARLGPPRSVHSGMAANASPRVPSGSTAMSSDLFNLSSVLSLTSHLRVTLSPS